MSSYPASQHMKQRSRVAAFERRSPSPPRAEDTSDRVPQSDHGPASSAQARPDTAETKIARECIGAAPDVTVKQMAHAAGMSVSTFYSKWDGKLTPAAFLAEVRLEQVKTELARDRSTIRDVSWQFRFCDEHYFSRWFRHRMGISPKQYQMRIRRQRRHATGD
jgi:AraC-like DNA-binding protein